MDNYLKTYGDIELHRRMVSDRVRTDAFAAAIHEVVQPGDVVLDVGTGTGILAMIAAKAGAKQVYGIDATDISDTATELVEANGLSDQVQIIQGLAGELQLDQKVDLIVSEWLGNAAFAEGMLHAVLDTRDNNLKPTGRMLPAKVRVLLAPLDEPILYNGDGPGYWREPIHNLDFSSLQKTELHQGGSMQIRVDPASLLAQGQTLLEIDLLTVAMKDLRFEGKLEFTPVRDGVLNGFCVWFEAELSQNVLLDTGPNSPETHWSQTYMSYSPIPLCAGQPVQVDVDFFYDPDTDVMHHHVDLYLGVGKHEQSFQID